MPLTTQSFQPEAEPLTYTITISAAFAREFADWRPVTELATEMKVETHRDGTAEILLRKAP